VTAVGHTAPDVSSVRSDSILRPEDGFQHQGVFTTATSQRWLTLDRCRTPIGAHPASRS
jgi:hypothetical protein